MEVVHRNRVDKNVNIHNINTVVAIQKYTKILLFRSTLSCLSNSIFFLKVCRNFIFQSLSIKSINFPLSNYRF